ncbi:MAG: TPM domain-containing protein [Candidatus Paceibacterota bacterium]
MLKKFLAFSVLVLAVIFPSAVFAYSNPGNPAGFVNDFAGVLSAEQKQQLEQKLSGFEKSAGNEISIAVIKSLDGDTIENFAVELFKDWGIGKEGQDNGALILVAVDDRQMRIEVGYGLEPVLTDAQSSWIVNNQMAPAFKNNDFYGGLNAASDKIISATGGEIISEENTASKENVNYFNILAFIIFAFVWLGSVLSRSKSWWAGGVVGGIAGIIIGFIKGFLYFGIISLVILIPLGLFFDFIASKTYSKSKSKGKVPPWWIGGAGFGGSGKGGGFGGFGGFGGGSSGGGGASGRW